MKIFKSILISFRRFRSEKLNTAISISGLVLALSIVSLILIYILNELNYNQFYKNKDRIVRVLNYDQDGNRTWATTPFKIGEIIKNELPEVVSFARQYSINNAEFQKGNDFIEESDVLATDSSFFNLFGIPLLQGNILGFQESSNKVLISKSTAKKYFGNADPLGQNICMKLLKKKYDLEIIGVFADIPVNSSVKAKIILNNDMGFKYLAGTVISDGETDEESMRKSWGSAFFCNFLLLDKNVSVDSIQSRIQQVGEKYASHKKDMDLSVQAMNDIYFHSEGFIDNLVEDRGTLQLLIVLGLVGFLILLVAGINFVNLAIAQSLTRFKTYAVLKSFGASYRDILKQLILDYCLLSILSIPFALALAQALLPKFGSLLNKNYNLSINSDFLIGFLILLSLSLLLSFFSAYFTFYKFKKSEFVNLLKGNKTHPKNKLNLQKGMVVFHLFIFIVLFICTIGIQNQMHYAFHKDLGFPKNGLLCLNIGYNNKEVLQEKISKIPSVQSVSATMWSPQSNCKMYVTIPRVDRPDENASIIGLFVDYNFAEVLGLEMIMGEDLDEKKFQSGVLVNQRAVKELGLTDIIGEKTAFGEVRGVIKDFHMYSLREGIPPMIIKLSPHGCRQILIRYANQTPVAIRKKVEKVWEECGEDNEFNLSFMDDNMEELYKSDIRISKILAILSFVIILIASVGLLGLSLFMSKQRTKEIGVRKANGAKTFDIIRLLNKDYVRLVIIASIIALPVGYGLMNLWLKSFVYKAELSWWIFALSVLLALLLTLLTVSLQSWRTASRKPIESLRYE